ncbi:zf-HC2 domain-containing protein [Kribbella sp. NPDC050281]|uniref:anti-sigma factor family protein n=1 Tax=Kribbella sp. NPDC050281 TaxID=3155515 RepID=UPI0033DEA3D6
MKCPETIAIGAYVLGALDSAERHATDQHLRTCASCREALLQFAPLPGLLHSVPPEDLEAEDPAPLPLPPRPVRRTRRWILAAAATVAVVAAGGVVGWQAIDTPDSVTWTATNGVGGIDTTAELTSKGWGTDIQLRMSDLKPGEHCELLVHGRDGSVETAGWWATTSTYKAKVPASTSIALKDIERLEVVTSGNTVLSTVSPETR